MDPSERDREQLEHCTKKITELAAQQTCEPRTLFQLGYNLGRLSELTGLGREPFWDRWKDPVLTWNILQLTDLARELPQVVRFGRPAEHGEPELPDPERLGV